MKRVLKKLFAIMSAAVMLTSNVAELSAVFAPSLYVSQDITVYDGSVDDHESSKAAPLGTYVIGDEEGETNKLFELNFLAPDGSKAKEYYNGGDSHDPINLPTEFPSDWKFTLNQDEKQPHYYWASATDGSKFPQFVSETNGYNESLNFPEYFEVWVPITADDKADDEKITGGYQRIRYQFKNVTVDDVPVTFIGAIEFNNNYYFYYSTASEGTNSTVGVTAINVKDNSSGIIAPEDVRKFTVNYEQAPYNIYYSVKVPNGDGTYTVIYKDLIQIEDEDHNLTTLEYDADLKVGGTKVSDWLDNVFGANRVSNLVHDGSYSFSVTTPVEYTAEVFRYFRYDKAYGAGAEASVMRPNYAQVTRHGKYPIGTEPVYERNGDTINPNKEKGPTVFSLTATFPADNVTEDRLIQAVLTERTYTPMFDATMWLKTANAGGDNARGTTGAGFGQDYSAAPGNILPESGKGDGPWNWGSFKTNKKEMTEDGDGYTIDWYFQTNDKDKAYFMDSFELNGVGLTVPFYPTQNYKSNTEIPEKERDGKSVTYTTLPGGAVARLEFYREFGSTEKLTQRVYRLTITNAKTNVTVTGGNLMMFNGGAPEISVYSLEGTYLDGEYIDGGDEDTRYLNYIQAFVNGKWVSQKLAKVIIEQNTDFTFATDNGKGNIRFKLLPSYEDPEYTFKPYEDGKEPLQSGSLTDGDKITKDDDGWYYITLKDNGKGENPDGVRFALLTITATPAKYTIEYLPNGDYSEDIVATDEEKKELVGNPIEWDPDSVMADVTSYEEEDDEGNKKLDEDGNPIIHYYDSNRISLGDRTVDQMYDRDVYNTVTVIHNVPVDLNGKMRFVGWKIVQDVNRDKFVGEYADATINAGQGIDLDKISEYWNGKVEVRTDPATGITSKRYVIKLEAVWEPIPAVETEDITYDIYVRRVKADGTLISQDERLAREAAVIIKNEDESFNATASVFIDINSGEVLDWLKKNPTYSVYKNGTTKESVLFGTVSKNNSKELENGVASIANALPQNRFYVAVVEDRGPLTFDIAKGDNDKCDDKTFDVVIKAPSEKVTSGMFFKYSETAEDSMLMDGIKPDEIDAYTFDGDELKINGLKPGEEVTIYVLAGDGYYITETYGTGKDTDDKYDIRVAKTVKGTVENDKLAESKGANKVDAAVSVSTDSHSNSNGRLISSPTHYVIYNTLVPTTLSVKKMQAKVVNGVVGTKTDARLDVTPGDIVEYTVTVKNSDVNRAHDTITIADTIPEGTELVGDFNVSRGTAKNDNGKITWTFDKLNKGASETLTYRVKVSATTAKKTTYSSTAQVDKGSKGYYYVNEITDYDGSPSTAVLNVLTGTLTLGKTINSVNGVEIDKDQEFTIKITLAGFPDTITKTNGVLNSVLTFDTVKTTSAGDVNGTLDFKPTLGGAIWTATVNLKHDESITIKGLSIGVNYEIEEINIPKNYKLDKYKDNAFGEIKDDENVAVYNDRKTGELDITKTVTRSDGLEVDEEEVFTFTLTLTEADGTTPITCDLTSSKGTLKAGNDGKYTFTIKHGDTIKIKGIPADAKYTVEENLTTEQAKIYVKTVSPASGTVGADSIVVVGATNQRFTGELEIEKEVTGSGGDKNKRFEFTVYLYESDGTTELTGSYEYIFTPAPSTAATQALDAPAAIAATKNPTVKSGGKVELRHGEKITIVGLPVGAKYKIVETAEDGYTSTVNGTVTDKAEGSIPNGKETVKFTNAKGTGKLKLSKTVTTTFGEDQTKEFKFTVTLKDDDGNTLTSITGYYNTLVNDSTSGKVLFDEGVATVKLKHNETVEITGLPVGAHYTVEEESDDNYQVTSTGATGKIVNNDDGVTKVPVAAFTNTRKTSGLEIKKNIVHTDKTEPSTAEKALDFVFKVTLSDTTIIGTFGGMTFTNGVAEFTLKHGETKTATGLPVGITYTVEETDSQGYTVSYSYSDNAKKIVADATAQVEVTNELTIVHEGNLKVAKTVVYSDGSAVRDEDKAKGFTFTLTLKKDNEVCEDIDGTYGDITFNKGVANFTLKHGETKTATGLPAGISYTVVETGVNGYTISYNDSATDINAAGTIPDNDTAEVNVTNTKLTGGLKVSKNVKHSDNSALDAADTDRDFTIIVTLSDNTINGVYGEMAFMNGVAVFTIKHGGTKTAAGLPKGITYTVVETKYEGYSVSYDGNTGAIGDNTVGNVVVTNTKTINKTGSLAVSKTVKHTVTSADDNDLDDVDKNKVFTFTVTIYEADGKTVCEDIDGTYGDMVFSKGVATVTLKHGETKTAEGLPEKLVYAVVESDDSDYTLTGKRGDTGAIVDGGTVTAAFTNTRKTGGLTVTKNVKHSDGSDLYDGEAEEVFTITVTLSDTTINGKFGDMTFTNGEATLNLSDSDSATAAGLPFGITYTVEEADSKDYTVSYENETGMIAVGITAEATVTNTKSITTEGNLKVTKTVAYSDGAVRDEDKTKEFTFTLTLKKDNKVCEDIDGTYGDMVFGKGVANFTLTDGETKVAKGLPAGITYTVVETAADGYTVSYNGNVSSGTITAGKTDEISVTNTKSVGNLTVSKTVAHSDDSELDAAEEEIEFAFTVTLSDSSIDGAYGDMTFNGGVAKFSLKHGDHMTATGLPTGTMYVVTEDANGEYTVTSTGRVGTIAKKDDTGAAQAVAAFTNTKESDDENDAISDLTVENLVSGGSTTKSFGFTLTLEDAEGNGIATPLTIKMGDGEEQQTLEAGDDGTYTFDLKHGDIITFIGLPVGTKYDVVEEEDENYIVRKSGYNGEIADGSNTAVFVYVVKRGSLTVSNTVTGTAGDTDKEFTFTVTVYEDSNKTTKYTAVDGKYGDMTFVNGVAIFTLKHGEHKTASALPSGAVYEVVESDNEGYTVTKTGDTGSISEKTNASANFVNNKEGEVGKLTVSNTVTGNGGDTNKKFKFTITLYKDAAKTAIYEEVDGTYGNITFGKGVATVELAHGESVTAIGLPAGITYTVVESDNEGYDVTATGDEGTIPANDEAKAVFINDKDEEPVPETWNLSVKKTITNENPDTNKYFTFKARLYKDADRTVPYELNGFFGDMAFINGVATFTLKHGDTKTAIGLPVKTEDGLTVYYSVSEVPSSGYNTTTPKSSTGKAAKDGNVVVEIKNTKIEESEEKLGNLIVSKTVSGTAQHDVNEEFGFMVILSDESVIGILGDMNFVNGVAEFTLKANEHKTAIGLPAGITYTVIETDSKDYTPSVESKTGKIPENKDEYVQFNNHKDEDIVSDPGTGSLIVTMLVEGTAPYFGNEFTVIVTLYGDDGVTVLEDINATYGNMTFVNGVATLKLAHNGSAYAIGLPAGTRYTVVETDGQDYEVTYNGKVAANASGVIIADDTVEVVITNTKDADPEPEPKFGGLSVTKTVVHADGSAPDNDEAQKRFSFTVTIYEDEANTIVYKGVDGTYGNMLFGEGVANFTLTHGQSLTATGLPAGLYYTVEEDNYDGYTSESVLAAGTIKDDGTVVEVKYTNIKEEEPVSELGSLKVTMMVNGTAEHDPNAEFKFKVELRDASVNDLRSWVLFSEQLGAEPRDTSLNGLYGDMYFNNGVAEFTLKAGESKIATDLPAGLTFTVTETDSKGYGVTNNNATVTIVKDDTVEVVVTNTMDKEPEPAVKLGSLKVTNTVTGTAGETNKEFKFTVKLDDETINGKHGDMEFTKGLATFTLKHGEFKTATGLPDGTGYTVTESDNEGYAVTKTGDTGKIVADDTVIAAFTNQKDAAVIQTGDLIVTNTVSGNAANYYQVFSFTVILSDSTVNGIYGQMTFENGVAFFGLMHGQSITAKGLPAGITYTVIENNSADHIVRSTGETGTIIANGTRVASFTNTRNTTWTPTPTVPQIPSTEPEKPDEPKEPEIIVDMPVEPGETDDEINGEDDEPAEDDATPAVTDELEEANPHTGLQISGLFAVSIAMLAAIAVVAVRRRCR